MKVNFSQEIKTIEGETLQRAKAVGDKVEQVPATLKWAVVEALLAPAQSEDLTGEEKAQRYELALKIQGSAGELDVSVDDVSLIKKLCDAQFTPLVVGQVRRMLDPGA